MHCPKQYGNAERAGIKFGQALIFQLRESETDPIDRCSHYPELPASSISPQIKWLRDLALRSPIFHRWNRRSGIGGPQLDGAGIATFCIRALGTGRSGLRESVLHFPIRAEHSHGKSQ